MYNLIDSHDTSRILEICANNSDLVKLPYLFLFALPGAPSIFYGGEVGLSGGHDPENRGCMIWDAKDQNLELTSYLKKLISLRKEYPAFKLPDLTWLMSDDNLAVIIFKKDDLFFILNNNSKEQMVTLPAILQHKTLKDIYNNISLTTQKTLIIKPYGFYILELKKHFS